MGLVGALKNAGKVGGPVMTGILITWLDFTYTFRSIGTILLVISGAFWILPHLIGKRNSAANHLEDSHRLDKSR
jgi:hypothetical protein